MTERAINTATEQSTFTRIRKFLIHLSDSEPVGWCIITASTSLIWWNCYTGSLAAPAVTCLALMVAIGYGIAAAFKKVRIVPESAIVGSTRYAFVLYMLIVNARHGVSPGWAWFITAAYATAIVLRAIEWHRKRKHEKT